MWTLVENRVVVFQAAVDDALPSTAAAASMPLTNLRMM